MRAAARVALLEAGASSAGHAVTEWEGVLAGAPVTVEAAVGRGVQDRHGGPHEQLLEHAVAHLADRADLVEDRALGPEARIAANRGPGRP